MFHQTTHHDWSQFVCCFHSKADMVLFHYNINEKCILNSLNQVYDKKTFGTWTKAL
jgi:hypothetical protein